MYKKDPDWAAYRDNPDAIARCLDEKFRDNDYDEILKALSGILRAQNVQALAREIGLRRDGLYSTFDGKKNLLLARVMDVFEGLGVRFSVTRIPDFERPERPKLGRPPKQGRQMRKPPAPARRPAPSPAE
jgi:probable addiction module antidote protein